MYCKENTTYAIYYLRGYSFFIKKFHEINKSIKNNINCNISYYEVIFSKKS
jgi:hypothetical protein